MIIYHNSGLFRISHITFYNFIDKGIGQCAFFIPKNMKRISIIMAFVISGTMAFAQIGVGNSNPQAVLDIRARDSIAPTNEDGILIPRVSTFSAINPTANQQGMLVFLTTTTGFNTPGFYYWDNPTQNWVGIVSTSNSFSSTTTLSFDGFEDFLYHESFVTGGYEINIDNQVSFAPVRTTSNGGASGYIDNPGTGGSDYLGHYVLTTGTASNLPKVALCSFYHVDKLRLGIKGIFFEGRVRIWSQSSTPNFRAYFGLMNTSITINDPINDDYLGTVQNGAPDDGVYFYFEDGANSGKWMATTKRGSLTTPLNTNVIMVTNQWYKLRAHINAAATVVDFYIDDVLVATSDIANTIPGPTDPMKWVFKIEKTSGTATRTLEIDYIGWRMVR